MAAKDKSAKPDGGLTKGIAKDVLLDVSVMTVMGWVKEALSKEGQVGQAHANIRKAIDESAGYIAALLVETVSVGGILRLRYNTLVRELELLDEHAKLGLYFMVAARAPLMLPAPDGKMTLNPPAERETAARKVLTDLQLAVESGASLRGRLDDALNDHGLVAECARQLAKVAEFLGRPASAAQIDALNTFRTRPIRGADAQDDGSLLSFFKIWR